MKGYVNKICIFTVKTCSLMKNLKGGISFNTLNLILVAVEIILVSQISHVKRDVSESTVAPNT